MSEQRPAQSFVLLTVNTAERKPVFADGSCARLAIECLYRIQLFNPFMLYAFVIMPDHCHLLVGIPPFESISRIIGVWKKAVSFEVGRPIWQNRFHLHMIESPERVIEYIHHNPVKRRLCEVAEEYPWSSASGRWEVQTLPLLPLHPHETRSRENLELRIHLFDRIKHQVHAE